MAATLNNKKDAATVGNRHHFDLDGFLIVRNVLVPDEVTAYNAAIDRHAYEAVPWTDPTLRKAIQGSPM